MPRRIASRSHRVVKDLRKLRRSSFRDEHGLFIVEGPGLINEAVRSGAGLKCMLFTIDRAAQAGLLMEEAAGGREAESYEIGEDLLAWVSDVVTSQGMIGVFEQVDRPYDDVLAGELTSLLVADQVRDPGNMGSLIRVADAAGADAFLTTPGSVDLYNPKVVRSSAGSHFHMPLVKDVSFERLVADMRERGVRTLGLEPRGGSGYLDEDLVSPHAIVMGNEAFGFSDYEKEMLDGTLHINMPGKAESLNVATAAAVVMFEAVRQRHAGKV